MRPQTRWIGSVLVGIAGLQFAVSGATTTTNAKDPFTPAQRKFWSFQPIHRVTPPTLVDAAWVATTVDQFVFSKLESKGLKPAPAADRITLLRRISFDLIGLPPTPEEVDAFVSDRSPNAYEKVVDRLLASPHYGERWARHWLDLARYAESEGFKSDETRPNAWRYRDYVIQAFNQNKPYDRFIQEQLAGDELWPNDPQARVATAFNRHYPDESNARNLMQRRQEILDDVTDTVGATFLAMTYGCARCHTHKFDPILHTDYYRLQAFFANTAADDEIPMIGPEQMAQYRQRKAAWEEKTKPVRDQIAALLEPKRRSILKDFVDKYPQEIQDVIAKAPAERNPFEWQMYYKAKPYLNIDDKTAAAALKGEDKKKYELLAAELNKFADLDPGDPPLGIGMRDLSAKAPATHRLAVGAWDAPQEEVQPGFLSIVDPNPPKIVPPADGNSTGRRTALAKWIASPDNPLTARVMVNRIWSYHFGRGIVDTPSDFGAMGGRPSHPELLDWLASEFVNTGWDVKKMHKLIVMSNSYRQSSAYNAEAAKADPREKLLWRFPRERLEGEEIRDAALSVAGLLNENVGGPSVFPELPAGTVKPRGGWSVNADPGDRNRRSVYIFVRRNARYPMLEVFDMPDTHESCGRRNQTITAPQAMSLLNGKISLEWAQAFAGRVLKSAGVDSNAQVNTAYRLAYGRLPNGAEKDVVLTFFAKQKPIIAERAAAAQKLALPSTMPEGYDRVEAAALVDFCQMLLNSNEFVYRN
jgi:hypothetical protein